MIAEALCGLALAVLAALALNGYRLGHGVRTDMTDAEREANDREHEREMQTW